MLEVLIAMPATLAFSILFGAPRSQWVYCSAVGGVGWLVNLLSQQAGTGPVLASFFATLALSALSRLFSHWRKCPVTVFLIAGIFPLVPGAGLYYTAFYLFSGDFASGMVKGVETLKFAGAITLGILFGFSLPPRLFSWLPLKKHKKSAG